VLALDPLRPDVKQLVATSNSPEAPRSLPCHQDSQKSHANSTSIYYRSLSNLVIGFKHCSFNTPTMFVQLLLATSKHSHINSTLMYSAYVICFSGLKPGYCILNIYERRLNPSLRRIPRINQPSVSGIAVCVKRRNSSSHDDSIQAYGATISSGRRSCSCRHVITIFTYGGACRVRGVLMKRRPGRAFDTPHLCELHFSACSSCAAPLNSPFSRHERTQCSRSSRGRFGWTFRG